MLTITPNPLLNPPAMSRIEAEMRHLPHITRDRQQTTRSTRRTCRDARRAKDATQAIGKLPGAREALHLVVSGRFALFHLIPAVMELSGQRIKSLTICTLGFSKTNIDELCRLIDSGAIGSVTLLASHYFAGTSSAVFEHAKTALAKHPSARFLSARTHAKLLLIELEDGRTIAIESSANLRSCKNIEQMSLIGDPQVYHFHRAWIDELFAAGRGRTTR